MPFKNIDTVVIMQIETIKGLENCDSIAAVEGLDVLAVGANDMTFSLGIQGQFEHPLLTDAMERVIQACKKYGKIGKCHPHHTSQIAQYSNMGYTMMMANSDVSHFRSGVKASVEKLRENSKILK